MKPVVLCAVLVTAVPAHADEPASSPSTDEADATAPVTADDVRGAPRPGQESGRIDGQRPDDSAARKLGRAVLLVPRIPLELVAQPMRGVLYVQDRYDVIDGAIRLFSTEDRKLALFPTALFETGLGFNIGARGFVQDMFGADERVTVRAAFGGEYLWIAAASVDSGRLLPGPLVASAEARFAVRDTDRFYGYGNGDLIPAGSPIDPLSSDAAVASRFRVSVARVLPRLTLRLPWHLSVTATAAVVRKRFEPNADAADPAIDEAYMIDRVPGFDEGTTFLYDELQIARDTRRHADRWDPGAMRGTGSLALVFVGRQQGLRDEPTFYRAGVDLQRFFRLTRGPRVLELRGYGELVTGDRDEVPFSELPRLGGPSFLRGYESDRFRDRVAIVGQASYHWAVATWLAPALFVDVGRVYPGLDELSLERPRVGYGLSVDLLGDHSLWVRAEVASSIDGGFFAYLAFNPAFDARTRVERY